MGNQHSSSIISRSAGALDAYVSELGQDVVYDKSLGSSRFLKTVRCRHRNGYLVCKIFIKPDTNPLDERYLRRLKKEKKALQDVPNVYSYQVFLESEKAGYLVRQWVASSLYDRISTRPFLTVIEKKWIAFQILTGLKDARRRKISHGDIKSENILVTSWNWVYITDFASYKPTFLPLDNPSDFAYFYDTSGRRNCYIAPERFYTRTTGEEIPGRDGKVTEAMDVFSAGCVLAELFLEGTALFTLSQLFKYREGELDIDTCLEPIEDSHIRALIKHMVALDPNARPTFESLLQSHRDRLFPECFYTPFYDFISSVNDICGSSPFTNTSNTHIGGAPTQARPKPLDDTEDNRSLPNDSDRRMARICVEFDMLEPCLSIEKTDLESTITKIDYVSQYTLFKPIQSIIPIVIQLPNSPARTITSIRSPAEDGPALIILSLICANLRSCCLPSSKLLAMDMLLALSSYLTDEAKLDRLLPYVMELLHEEWNTPLVRAAALRTVLQVLALVNAITPFNADIFPQYVLPYLRYLTSDPEVSVRTVSAQSIVHFANLSMKYLEMGQALRAHGIFRLAGGMHHHNEVSYDASWDEIQKQIEEHLVLLLVDQSSVVKRSILLDIAPLCIFLGRQKTNDILLSHMITYLNDRDWLLRYAFFESIVDVATCLGGRNLEEYIFPLMTQALSDAEETNVARVLASLTALCELGLFQKMRLWELMSGTLQLLYHPNIWIRQGASAFIASAANRLPSTDAWCILYPSLKHYLRSDIKSIDVRSILVALKAPLPRHLYDFAADWASRADNTLFWKSQRKLQSKADSPKEAAMSVARKSGRVAYAITARSEEDDLQLNRLEQLGMTPTEEKKLVALRDYLAKFSASVQSMRSRPKPDQAECKKLQELQTTGHVELQKLGVSLHTVFLGSRSARLETTRRASTNRLTSFDYATGGGGAPFEDLRRRLATINGSNTSLNSATSNRDRRSPPVHISVQQRVLSGAIPASPTINDLPPMRPSSPTESVISTSNSISLKPRFSVGSLEGVKAAPAIGSVRTNAIGLLEAPGRPPSEILNDRSGMTSPASFGTTIRDGRSSLPFAISEDGQDTTVNRFLEDAYMESNKDMQHDFGPRVHEGPVRRRNPPRQSYSSRDPKRRHLEASLISHLNAHTDAVTGLAVSPDHVFFVTVSDDKTVKVWDSTRLERNVTSKPRHVYQGHQARVKCVCMLEGHHCFASAAEDGSLHVVRVHITQTTSLPKYTKFETVRDYRVDRPGEYIRCMSHYNTETSSNLIYATNYSMIVVLDLKSLHVIQNMENPRHFGPVVSFCTDRRRTWLVAAGMNGILTLWDLRFGLLLRNWKVQAATDDCVVQLRQCVIHPTKGRGKWVMVSLEVSESTEIGFDHTLVEVWDVEKAQLMECFVSRSASDGSDTTDIKGKVSYQPAESDYASAIAALVRNRKETITSSNYHFSPSAESSAHTSPTVTAMAPGSDFGGHSGASRSFVDISLEGQREVTSGKTGFVVVGTDDCKIKLWNLDKFAKSVVLSDQEGDYERNSFSVKSSEDPTLNIENVPSSMSSAVNLGGGQRSSLISGHQQDLLKAHKDSISCIACIDSPFKGGIISGDRSGVVKVWRVEGSDGQPSGALYS